MIDWRHWHNEPYLVGGLLLLAWLYAVATGPLRQRLGGAAHHEPRRAWCYYSALVIFYVAVGSPLDQIAERFLLSAHMLQHLLLVYPAAALFLFGLPPWFFRAATGPTATRPVFQVLTHPLTCGIAATVTFTIWHAPLLYDLALQNKVVHAWEHIAFFGAGLFFWWPLLSPAEKYPPLAPALQILYLLAVMIGMTPVFAYITFSSDVLYPTYEFAPRLVASLTPAGDQLLAGVAMKFVGMGVAVLMIGVAFLRWYRRDEQNA